MPTYSYRCKDCDTAFDIQQAFSDASLTECPACGGSLRKVFSAIGVSFNGSGFYRNDSRAAPKSDSGSGSGSSSGDSGSSGSSSSESGSAKKETAKKETAKKDSTPSKAAAPST